MHVRRRGHMRHRVHKALVPSNRFPQLCTSVWLLGCLAVLGGVGALGSCTHVWATASGEPLPTGVRITPEAAEGALFRPLQPNLPSYPEVLAGQAVTTAVSPDSTTLL